jgi:hypothetical protein
MATREERYWRFINDTYMIPAINGYYNITKIIENTYNTSDTLDLKLAIVHDHLRIFKLCNRYVDLPYQNMLSLSMRDNSLSVTRYLLGNKPIDSYILKDNIESEVKNGNYDNIKILLKHNPSIPKSFLNYALRYGRIKVYCMLQDYIIKENLDIDLSDEVFRVASYDIIHLIDRAIRRGYDARNSNGYHVIQLLIKRNLVNTLKYFLDMKVVPENAAFNITDIQLGLDSADIYTKSETIDFVLKYYPNLRTDEVRCKIESSRFFESLHDTLISSVAW